ncbi:hypothetical protein H7F33_05740 [Pedobacter sp. PAMC26386]|nr:hypothetical protein H7F33_05740 [Pedobacter sp. PAMC26386]
MSLFLRSAKEFFRTGFKEVAIAPNKTPYNMAVSANLFTGVTGRHPNRKINWDGIVVSDGNLARPANVVTTMYKDEFHFSWAPDYDPELGSENDRTIILAYCNETKLCHFSLSGGQRKDLKDTFKLPLLNYDYKSFEVFIAFKDTLSNQVSRSIYCGHYDFNN